MKITDKHYKHIYFAMVEKVFTNDEVYNSFEKYEKAGLTPKRFRWDCLHISVPSKWICDNIYPYANDTHIDTVLRSIMNSFGLTKAAK